MKGFVSKLAESSSCTRVLSNRRNSVCAGALPKPPCVQLSTTARRLSVDINPTIGKYAPRRASADASLRRSSVDLSYTPRRPSTSEQWSIPTTTFPREITWLAGAPGAGKGTNSSFIAKARGYHAPTIVMSSLLENPECKRIKDAGGMVDDETVQKALLEELAKPEYRDGVVVDGFPRTEKQAEWLRSLHDTLSTPFSPINFNFVMLFIDEEASVARQLSRGESIRKLNSVRTANGMAPLEERATDVSEAAARVRYANFVQQYETVNKLSERFPLAVVDASAPIETVRQRISSTLKTTLKSPQQQHQQRQLSPTNRPLSPSQRHFASTMNAPILSAMKKSARSYAYV